MLQSRRRDWSERTLGAPKSRPGAGARREFFHGVTRFGLAEGL